MKKILSVLAIVFLLASLLIPLVSATEVIMFESTPTGTTSHLYNLHPTGGSGDSAAAQVFNSSATGYLTSAKFYMARAGSPQGELTCYLMGVTGTVGVDATPNATIFAESNTVSMADVSTSYTDYMLIFNGTYQLTQYKEYAIVLAVTDNTACDGSNEVRVGYGTGTSATNRAHYNTAAWIVATTDYRVRVAGDTSSGVTPTPTPASTASTGDADMEALTDAILPFLVPLLICLIPALLGYKFVGEFGFFIGLNVGCILAYVTLASTAYAFPLWGIILVGVMDVAVVLMRR